jgi:dihydrofolate synthase/folylpolyglutamate synthase
MALLDDPQNAYDIIHIGGTSGKGSISIFCESMLRALGHHVGTHTSPYLQTPLEKVRVDGRLILPADAIALTDRVMEAVRGLLQEEDQYGHPHYAEAWVALALRHFADAGCDVGVVEVGMGGRYDATNIVTPRVSVISTVHYDHVRVLGDTLEEIAFHKAGIIKAGVPAVVGNLAQAALKVVEREASERGAKLIQVGRDVTYRPISLSRTGGRFDYDGLSLHLHDAETGLLGAHQFANAAAALAALEVKADYDGVTLDREALRHGLASARFAGRLEVMQEDPLVVLDGAHNEEKIAALMRAMPEVFEYERLVLVLGLLEAKQAGPIIERLARMAQVVVCTSPTVKGKPALSAAELADLVRKAGVPQVEAVDAPLAALQTGIALAQPGDLVMVTGSLYLIGMVRGYWHPTMQITAAGSMFGD